MAAHQHDPQTTGELPGGKGEIALLAPFFECDDNGETVLRPMRCAAAWAHPCEIESMERHSGGSPNRIASRPGRTGSELVQSGIT
ncbi:hypothetical protein ACQP1G_24970 [Nocardia sp. CA-107356]|uniref:hypothetical protein n=1 Tax=Nocardia sp. CA-107356 TaxID=3239972 RepID=UPI003D8BB95D